MQQAILGLSLFVGLQVALFLVLFGVTLWEARQLNRPVQRRPEITPMDRSASAPPKIGPLTEPEDLPLSA